VWSTAAGQIGMLGILVWKSTNEWRFRMAYFRMLAAIPGFFLSSLFFMLLWDAIAPKLDLADINYATSMLVVVTLWIAVAPLAAVGKKRK
jgi:hypothetical protein